MNVVLKNIPIAIISKLSQKWCQLFCQVAKFGKLCVTYLLTGEQKVESKSNIYPLQYLMKKLEIILRIRIKIDLYFYEVYFFSEHYWVLQYLTKATLSELKKISPFN